MRALLLPPSLFALVLAVGCRDSQPVVPTDSGPRDATTSSTADALPRDLGARDSGGLDLGLRDLGTPIDTGAIDTGGMPGVACVELLGCCAELPANLQSTCDMAANGGDEARCQQVLDIARNSLGACAAPGMDAGPTDAVTLGPVCSELQACCPQTGNLQGLCDRISARGNEGTCGTILNLAMGQGLCGPMVPDTGVPEDAQSLPDTGTATVTADAGVSDASTSTTGADR